MSFEHFDPEVSDVCRLMRARAAEGASLPRLFQCCGTEDFTYPMNLKVRDCARELGLDLTWEEGPGAHNFDFWDPWIRRILDWLPLDGTLVAGK